MKTQLSFRDVERLSAYLDGQLPQAEAARLRTRLESDPELAALLVELREARTVLRRTPQRRAPRNFTLTPRMAGIRPPVPRAVPALSWASVAAVLMFVFTLGGNLLTQIPLGASAPMMAAAPSGMGGAADEAYAAATEVATEAPVQENAIDTYGTATPEMYALTAPEATTAPDARSAEPPNGDQAAKTAEPVSPWLIIWPGLALLLGGAALLLRWQRQLAFKRKLQKK